MRPSDRLRLLIQWLDDMMSGAEMIESADYNRDGLTFSPEDGHVLERNELTNLCYVVNEFCGVMGYTYRVMHRDNVIRTTEDW